MRDTTSHALASTIKLSADWRVLHMYTIIDEQGEVPVGPFASWDEARAFQAEHQVPGRVVRRPEPTELTFASNPEPQEMTASWARRMARGWGASEG